MKLISPLTALTVLQFLVVELHAQIILRFQLNFRAKKILRRLRNAYSSFNAIKINYSVIIEYKIYKERQEASILIKDKKYNLIQDETQIICNGQNVWIFNKKQTEVRIYDYNPKLSSPDYFLKIYEKEDQFVYLIIEENESSQVLEFRPVDKGLKIEKVQMVVRKNSPTIQSIKVFENNGVCSTFLIKNTQDAPSSSKNFHFYNNNYPNL